MIKLKENQEMYIKSMGKHLRITGIFNTHEEANNHCAKSNDGVIAVFGNYIFTAELGDKGVASINKEHFEMFLDRGYFDLWCVRNKNDQKFDSINSFHFNKKEDAERFKELMEIAKKRGKL